MGGGVTRGWRALTLAAVLVPVLSACNVWAQLGHGPDNTRFNPDEAVITPDNVDDLAQDWSAHVDGSFSEPILSDGRVYSTVVDGTTAGVRAYNVDTGALLWTRPLPPPGPAGGPGPVVMSGGALWVASVDHSASGCSSQLRRIDPANGAVLTTETVSPRIIGSVVADGTTVAYTTGPGCNDPARQATLVVRDTSAGTSWTYRFPSNVWPGEPSIGDDTVYVGADNDVYAFTAAGCGAATCTTPAWTTPLSFDGNTVWANDRRPTIGPDGTLYVGADTSTQDTFVQVLDGETGTRLWRTDLHAGGSGWQGLALADGRLFVSDQRYASGSGAGGAVEVFPAEGCGQPVCAPAWSATINREPVADLTVGGDVLYFGLFDDDDNRFVAFDADGCGAATCTQLASLGFGSEQPLRVAVAGGRVAVVTGNLDGETLRVLAPNP